MTSTIPMDTPAQRRAAFASLDLLDRLFHAAPGHALDPWEWRDALNVLKTFLEACRSHALG